MKIIHSIGNLQAEKEVKEEASFILTNKTGGYCYLGERPVSRYQGIFFNIGFKMYKVIDEIRVIDSSPVKELRNNFFQTERKRNDIVESFFMPEGFNSMAYGMDREKDVELVLDVRESYSSPEFGRLYEISEENGKLIVKYRQENEFECYLVISGYSGYEKKEEWIKRSYEFDKERNSMPYEKYVYNSLKISSKQLIFSFSMNKEEGIKENDFVAKNLDKLKKRRKKNIGEMIKKNRRILGKIKDNEIKMAYLCALNSLDSLVIKIKDDIGIYGGLPWFFHFWARDEAIAMGALKYLEKNKNIGKILMRLIRDIREEKILNRYPDGFLYSGDAIGWVLKRIDEFDRKLLREKNVKDLLGGLNDGFCFNNKNETWMDSIDRDGARIELQALKLAMLKAGGKQERALRSMVREKFWNGKYLKDGIGDETIRPNLFIAAYAYPELLSSKEWGICFENAIESLWLNWGGLSTIDKKSHLFCTKNTGENPLSYHNGDSWFWINNLAAIMLYRTDKKKFKDYIMKIISASAEEILWKGAIGHHAELSSASMLKSEGCAMQAWSSAMLIELLNEACSLV